MVVFYPYGVRTRLLHLWIDSQSIFELSIELLVAKVYLILLSFRQSLITDDTIVSDCKDSRNGRVIR